MPGGRTRRVHRVAQVVVVTVAVLASLAPTAPARSASVTGGGSRYVNPVSRELGDAFPDPSVIRGRDGYWYAYGTFGPLREGQLRRPLLPIARARDLVHWTLVGHVFDASNYPVWAADDAMFWAPDIRYFDRTYHLYYVATDTRFSPDTDDTAIGVATAPTPVGPWSDSGAPVVGPRRGPGDRFLSTLDPAEYTDADGARYLYYGSFAGGVWVSRLSRDGSRTVGRATRVTVGDRYEAPYLVRHRGYYYLFVSSGECCAGPTSGYSVFVGRSTSVRGPFRDRQGVSLNAPRAGGSLVLTPNGNRWIGTGHNSVVTDLAGRAWLVYHAVDPQRPFFTRPPGITKRPLLIDRLDWSRGWPTASASESPVAAPVATAALGSGFDGRNSLAGWQSRPGAWAVVRERGDGFVRRTSARCTPSLLITRATAPAAVRAEADLRLHSSSVGAAGLIADWRGPGDYLVAWLDAGDRALVLEAFAAGRRVVVRRARVPSGFDFTDWHNVALERRGADLVVTVTDARLNDPLARLRLSVPASAPPSGSIGVAARCVRADADAISGSALFQPSAAPPLPPGPGPVDPAYSDEFSGSALSRRWRWVGEPGGHLRRGRLVWRTQAGDLVGAANDVSVLLRPMPPGPYTVETRLSLDLGEHSVRNFQQAGLIVYVDDDLFLRLTQVAIGRTRQLEFGKEMPWAATTSYGQMALGAPPPTVWLRISHRTNPESGQPEFRAWMSQDGRHWQPGGVWSLPAGADPQVGLVAQGAAVGQPRATARFDYFRVHRP